MKCLHKDPGQRYATAHLLAEDLRRFLADRPIKARRISRAEQVWRWCRRNPAMAGLTAVILLLLVMVAVVSTFSSLWLNQALSDSKRANAVSLQANDKTERANHELEKANEIANSRLWDSYLIQARMSRVSRQCGQRFQSLRAIENALRLPLPPGRSLDELRTEASAALCVPDLEIARELTDLPQGYRGFALDANFERYAVGDKSGNAIIRRIVDNAELYRLPSTGEVDDYGGLEFSPDGQYLHHVVNGEQGMRSILWRLGKPVPVLTDEHNAFAFRADTGQCAAHYPDGSIRFYSLASGHEGELVGRMDTGLPGFCFLAWSRGKNRLAVATRSVCRVIDVSTGKTLWEKPQQNISWIDWHPDGNVLAISNFGDDQDKVILLWDIRTNQLVCPPIPGKSGGGLIMRFNHSGDRLLSNDWMGMLRLWDTRTGQQLLETPGSGGMPAVQC